MKKAIIIIIALLTIPSGILLAYGGGGGFAGYYLDGFSWDTSEIGFTGIQYKGGFGYGVASGGHRVGGFGLSLYDHRSDRRIGGFGGIITGQQLRLGFLTASVNIWLGIGGLNSWENSSACLAYFGEGTFELGVKIFSWLQLSGFAGWQTLGKLFTFEPRNPSEPFHPVSGFRVTWGDF